MGATNKRGCLSGGSPSIGASVLMDKFGHVQIQISGPHWHALCLEMIVLCDFIMILHSFFGEAKKKS